MVKRPWYHFTKRPTLHDTISDALYQCQKDLLDHEHLQEYHYYMVQMLKDRLCRLTDRQVQLKE